MSDKKQEKYQNMHEIIQQERLSSLDARTELNLKEIEMFRKCVYVAMPDYSKNKVEGEQNE